MPAQDYYLPMRRLVSQDDAAIIERADLPRSTFVGSWNHLTTFDAGYLIPILVDEILPGDHVRYDLTAYVRMSTPLFPIMSSQRIDTFFFYVPARILWENWVRFQGEQPDTGSSIDFTIPQVVSDTGGFAVGSIYDYMGVPVAGQTGAGSNQSINALPLRAYNRIFTDWFRDQNIVPAIQNPINNGADTNTWYTLRRRAKSHDYFTSALPWPQKFTAPTVPVAGQAPVVGIGTVNQLFNSQPSTVYESPSTTTAYTFAKKIGISSGGGTAADEQIYIEGDQSAGGFPQIFADLATAVGVSINTFRQAFLIQQLLERDARGGTRYVEHLKSHWGVTSPDFRLQRPEYIGGGQSPLTVTPIAQTAPDAGGDGLGALGAAGTGVGSHSASYAATEHGYIIGLINIRTELAYQQGLHKMWTRSTRYDFYIPALAGLGEQAVLRKEIYATADNTADNTVFGYQERWHEYRTRTSYVTGLFRSTSAGNIDPWHLIQEFSSAPTLSQTFIEDTPPVERVLAAGATAAGMQYLADLNFKRTITRVMPVFGTPVMLGRF